MLQLFSFIAVCISLTLCASTTHFTGARILLDHQIQSGELWVQDGKIVAPQPYADEQINLKGKIIAPGFIDLQINGGFGCDFSRNPEQISEVASQLLQYGVTSFLPTVICSSSQQYQAVLPKLQPQTFAKGATALGIHLEGPFFSLARRGAHNPQFIQTSFVGSIDAIYGTLQGVKLVTLAPELPGVINLVKELTDRGIIVAAGHSNATSEEMQIAINAGLKAVTHLFNAMPSFHHRSPSIIGSALFYPTLPYSVIVDGIHLCPEAVQLCWSCNKDGLILISDATEALGLIDGAYKLGTLDIEVRQGQIYLAGTQTLAGSNLNLNAAVCNLHAITKCTPAEALEAASLKPAQLIQAWPTKGTLQIGADADLIVLTDDLQVEATYIAGKLCWSNS
ncbi:MAG: N-acetylglucosamine-6-phosphate deacetylase [Chlamydiales bacterium]|nr:N-acetylglucosamine-6-phosphate deacetylase [Chlamydiales bacterium]